MSLSPYGSEYRIEDLAHHSGATVRTIRAYQDRGLLPRPERRGRANVYDDGHLARLRQIAGLLDRGYTLASIKELLQAWDEGRGLGGVLGLVAEVDGPWTDEEAGRLTREELSGLFGGAQDEEAVAEAVALGVLVPRAGKPDEFLVPSPQELEVAVELHRAGVPLLAVTEHLRELRSQVEHIAARFVDFTNEHVFVRYLGQRPSDEDADEAADLVRRLRPLAQQTVDAELARAMRTLATRNLRDHLRTVASVTDSAGQGVRDDVLDEAGEDPAHTRVRLPADTVAAVRELVGGHGAEADAEASAEAQDEERIAEFIAAAVEREVRARTMDRLASGPNSGPNSGPAIGPNSSPAHGS
ncbi:MerR family transcriptional regulator [Streptomyces sp. ODS28]|uniref:MerR family transcriptional regulator n=1 Tax=Streptomyces sp. ODS28 TaxID=3136688 RepID=UPI0031EA2D66